MDSNVARDPNVPRASRSRNREHPHAEPQRKDYSDPRLSEQQYKWDCPS